nr:MAG TPA: hypothetical protein [Bacteriophage sp.]
MGRLRTLPSTLAICLLHLSSPVLSKLFRHD